METPSAWLSENLGALVVVATACLLYEMIRIRQVLLKILDAIHAQRNSN